MADVSKSVGPASTPSAPPAINGFGEHHPSILSGACALGPCVRPQYRQQQQQGSTIQL